MEEGPVRCGLSEHVRVAGVGGPWAVVYTAHGQDALCAARKAMQGVRVCARKGGRISAEGTSAAEMGQQSRWVGHVQRAALQAAHDPQAAGTRWTRGMPAAASFNTRCLPGLQRKTAALGSGHHCRE